MRPLQARRSSVSADLHAFFQEDRTRARGLDFDRYNAVIFLGNIKRNDAAYIAGLIPENIPCLYVPGNHDEPGQYRQIPNLTSIDREKYTLNGKITIGGAGGSRSGKYADAGSSLCTRTEKEVGNFLKKMEAYISLPRTNPRSAY